MTQAIDRRRKILDMRGATVNLQSEEGIAFVSRRDTWLMIILGVAGALVFACLVLPSGGESLLGRALLSMFGTALLLFIGAMLVRTRYVVDEEALRVQCGFLRWRIATSSIVAAQITNDPTSGPALSLHRVRVDFLRTNGERDAILVSPLDREQFIAALVDANPSVQVLPAEG
jgi:hypothetical protein